MAELERWSNAVSAEKDPEFAAGLAGSGTRRLVYSIPSRRGRNAVKAGM